MDEQGEVVNGTQPVKVAHIHPLGILNSTQPIGETGDSNRQDGKIDEVTFNTGHQWLVKITEIENRLWEEKRK